MISGFLERRVSVQKFPADLGQFIPRILVLARKVRGINQTKLARSLGVTQAALSQLESGSTNLTYDRLEQWCKALGYKVSHVVRTAEIMKENNDKSDRELRQEIDEAIMKKHPGVRYLSSAAK